MFDYRAIHVALLLWACLLSLIAAVCMAINTNFEPTKRRWLLAMQLFGAVLMGCDALAWAYRGGAGEVGYWMVRVSSFLVFFASDLILLIFHGYVCCYHTSYSDGSGQQFITLVSKSGNTFYLVIDRNDKGENTVHFMNLVDEADLLALMEEDAADAYTAEKEAAAQAESRGRSQESRRRSGSIRF